MNTYSCPDEFPKSYRLIFSGCDNSSYAVEICKDCRQKLNKKFLIAEETIS